jgi:23S rRNA (adenine-N6)-dimethyltransferase
VSGARRTWGWYRLADEWAARVVADAGIRPGELVFDIGAGEGALTTHLLCAGACVIAVEPHPGRAAVLRARFPGTTVLELDAGSLRLPGRPFRVVANPPYSITASLLRQLLASPSGLTSACLVLQRAAVRKHAASRRRGFRLSEGLSLPRSAFTPQPRVDSAVLVVKRR